MLALFHTDVKQRLPPIALGQKRYPSPPGIRVCRGLFLCAIRLRNSTHTPDANRPLAKEIPAKVPSSFDRPIGGVDPRPCCQSRFKVLCRLPKRLAPYEVGIWKCLTYSQEPPRRFWEPRASGRIEFLRSRVEQAPAQLLLGTASGVRESSTRVRDRAHFSIEPHPLDRERHQSGPLLRYASERGVQEQGGGPVSPEEDDGFAVK